MMFDLLKILKFARFFVSLYYKQTSNLWDNYLAIFKQSWRIQEKIHKILIFEARML